MVQTINDQSSTRHVVRRHPITISLVVGGALLSACASSKATPAASAPAATSAATIATTAAATTSATTASATTAPVTTSGPPKSTISFRTKDGVVQLARLANGTPPPAPAGSVPFTVQFRGQTIRGIDVAGPGPAIVLLHGFPDNLHLYDELIPKLSGKRRVIAFDFVGWGASDKPLPGDFEYTMATNQAELAAVLDQMSPEPVELVVHDASGIPGIDYAVANPSRVSRLVLLNTFYGLSPTQSPPYAINLYAAPGLQAVEQAVNLDPAALEGIYRWQLGQFLAGNPNANAVVDRLWSQFPEALPAFTALNDVLFDEVRDHTINLARLDQLTMPVDIVFGAKDINLTSTVAADLAGRIPGATLLIVEDAGHFVQIDAPDAVAARLLA